MQRLNPDMLARYDIPAHAPAAASMVQFGLGEALLGVADRLLDGTGLGVAVVAPQTPWNGEGVDPAALLEQQAGLYTVLVRGYQGETPVKREQVVQCVVRVIRDAAARDALAAEPGLALGVIDACAADPEPCLRQAARFLTARRRAGLGGLTVLCLGDDAGCAEAARDAVAALADGAGFSDWLARECAFLPALAEGLAFRADAREAARQCAEMNYADGLLHLAEPFARLTVAAPPEFRERWPLDRAEGIAFADDLAPALALKHRLYDSVLAALAAPGWLLGLDTLSDCMRNERLRAFVGHACYDELLPADPAERAALAPAVVECFERLENPLNSNRILPAARPLLRRFACGALPLMRSWAAERFEPPRLLSFSLAATIMLYAGARPDARGRWTVSRGRGEEVLEDDPAALAVFATLSHDMPPEALAYAALADRELWGADLRDIDGLEARVALDLANLQRQPDYLP